MWLYDSIEKKAGKETKISIEVIGDGKKSIFG